MNRHLRINLDPNSQVDGNGVEIIEPIPNTNPNLDLLSAPEGTDKDTNNLLQNLPNLDPPKTDDPPVIDPLKVDDLPKVDPPVIEVKLDDAALTAFTQKLKKKYGEDFKLPADTTPENFFDKVDELLAEKYEIVLHPEVAKFHKAIEAGVNPNDYIKRLTDTTAVETMDAKDLIKLSLVNSFGKTEARPNGWDDKKIEDTLTKMENSGVLDIEAEKIRNNYIQQKEQLADKLIAEQTTARTKHVTEMNLARENQIKESLSYFNQLNDIGGIPLSQSEKTEFIEDFKLLVTPDEKTGNAPLLEALQSNENLVKVAWLLRKGDAKIREALTLAKESVKNEFLNKLDKEPKVPKKSSTPGDGTIDYNALSAPATN